MVLLSLPFTGRWLVQNSPARRVPSHGTNLFATAYAIDFVGVDERRGTAAISDWRAWLSTEPPERYFSFGRPLLAPGDGVIAAVHDGEVDHEGRRSQLALVGYLMGQAQRARAGLAGLAGNYVVIELASGAFVALTHLRQGSQRVGPGDRVALGQHVADCGNSGNSTQPHVHVQAMDGVDAARAQALPVAFGPFRQWRRGQTSSEVIASGLPAEGSVVEPEAVAGDR